MDHIERLRAVIREIAAHGENAAIRAAAAAALEEPEFGGLPGLGQVIGSSRYAGVLIIAVAEAWNMGE